MKINVVARILGLSCVLLLGILSLMPGRMVPRTGAPHELEHFIAYFLTAVILGLIYRNGWIRFNTACILVLFAGAMELAQYWAIARGPHMSEWIAGGGGASVGIMTAVVIDRVLVRKFARQN